MVSNTAMMVGGSSTGRIHVCQLFFLGQCSLHALTFKTKPSAQSTAARYLELCICFQTIIIEGMGFVITKPIHQHAKGK